MTLFLSTSVCLAIIGPTTQNSKLVRSCNANVGPTAVLPQLKLKYWNNVGPMSARQQCRSQQTQPLSNVGPPIACCLGLEMLQSELCLHSDRLRVLR